MDEPENLSSTRDAHHSGDDSQESFSLLHPTKIGRYTILRRLGKGGFGEVFQAFDDDLNRPVAIKVPNRERITQPEDIEAYLNEAQIVANLDHPHIVPVYDVGRTEDGLCFVVSKYIEGSDLSTRIKESRPGFHDSAGLVATIAEALHFAHTRGLVHRDIKPGNILIDASGNAFLADFGLALKEEDFGTGARITGTPSYMSPEQARGEGHRVDGRSDIFSLGVVFYELLSGRRPFVAKAQDKVEARIEIMDLIATTEARPPRQIDDTIPKELERICLKALSKRSTERHNTALDMAEDVREFLKTRVGTVSPLALATLISTLPESTLEVAPLPSAFRQSDSDQRPFKIVPKGLRSFDEHDAEFFLELLPGPRDREGLPDSIRFWKDRIEEADPDRTFQVGLIYGPSGSGKSSLVKAGLLPRLAKHVSPVYVEATPEETESRLLRALRKTCPDLPPQIGLVDSLMSMRQGRVFRSGQKTLLVFDQFEQWLHAKRSEENTELVTALRQCDGEHLQAVVLVRADFWLAVSRFMADLEAELIPGQNIALVDLFAQRHAMKVLTLFGQAYGLLPERNSDLTENQQTFLDQAISGLTQDGKIVPVRLALFAEMVRERSWTSATLRKLGGTEGVGVTFLEETFASPQANPKHRLHQKAAQSVLKALLPETVTDIKGQMRSRQELLEASGYANRPREFDDLIHILDLELRLITPSDPEDSSNDDQANIPSEQYYQLAHDYLVHSLRDWLTRKQRETRRGHAELRLAERSASWNTKPEHRHLPSALEWANIRLLTKKKDWSDPQRRMMKRAGRVHGLRGLGVAVLIALVTWGGVEGYGTVRASSLVESLKAASTADVEPIINQLLAYRRRAKPRLVRLLGESEQSSREHLHASLALLPMDASQADYLYDRLLNANPIDLQVIWKLLQDNNQAPVDRLWKVLNDPKADKDQRFRAACALANVEADADTQRWDAVVSLVADRLLDSVLKNPSHYPPLLKSLRPVRDRLLAPLSRTFRDQGKLESERSLATSILSEYAADRPDVLTDLLMDSAPPQFAILFPKVESLASQALTVLGSELGRKPTPEAKEDDKDKLAQRQARAAVAMVRLGIAEEVFPLLRYSADPRLRSFIVNWLTPLGADPRTLVAELDRLPVTSKPTPANGQEIMDEVLFQPETSQRRALILALGTYGTDGLSPVEREPLTSKLLDLYRNDPDAGIHGATEWTLRKWGQQDKLKEVDADLMKIREWGDRRWFMNSQGQTYAVIEGPVEFRMGSPPTEPNRNEMVETARRMLIPRRFAIGAKEVTVEQWQRFERTHTQGRLPPSLVKQYSPGPVGPMIGFDWYIAANYCNWLSEQEGLPKDQWCYLPADGNAYEEGMTIPADVLERTGYRLPTEPEWEYACRSGTVTSRYYGQSTKLLDAYARSLANSNEHAWSCGSLLPNDLGLFDILGNEFEWVQDSIRRTMPERRGLYSDVIIISESILEKNPRVLRGGSFYFLPALVRSAYRDWNAPANRIYSFGLRPSRTYP